MNPVGCSSSAPFGGNVWMSEAQALMVRQHCSTQVMRLLLRAGAGPWQMHICSRIQRRGHRARLPGILVRITKKVYPLRHAKSIVAPTHACSAPAGSCRARLASRPKRETTQPSPAGASATRSANAPSSTAASSCYRTISLDEGMPGSRIYERIVRDGRVAAQRSSVWASCCSNSYYRLHNRLNAGFRLTCYSDTW